MALSTRDRTPTTGFLYRGRPTWLTDGVLSQLNDEALRLRGDAKLLRRQRHHACGEAGSTLASSPSMLKLIENAVGPAVPSHSANYLYYESEGDGIDPHIDKGRFHLNLLMLLNHEHDGSPSSMLMLFPSGPECPIPIRLEPGKMVLFWATKVFHCRTALGPSEKVLNMGIGYLPKFTLPEFPYWSER